MTEWSATLGLRPISRKNHLQIVRRGGRLMLIPSEAYQTYRDEAVTLLASMRPAVPLTGPLWLDLDVQVKGRMVLDIDNAISGVMDVLTEAQVIEDDKHIVHITADLTRGHKAWGIVMTLCPAIAKEEAA